MEHNPSKQKYHACISHNFQWHYNSDTKKHILVDKRTKIEYDPYDINTKIMVYEDRVRRWFLDIADRLKTDDSAGFVILQIAISYIEGNQQLRDGSPSINGSRTSFINAMKRIFNLDNTSDVDMSEFHNQVRCGLFHDGITREKVFLSGEFTNAISVNNNQIYINPHKFLDKIVEDLSNYITLLRNGTRQETDNFEKMFYFGQDKL